MNQSTTETCPDLAAELLRYLVMTSSTPVDPLVPVDSNRLESKGNGSFYVNKTKIMEKCSIFRDRLFSKLFSMVSNRLESTGNGPLNRNKAKMVNFA